MIKCKKNKVQLVVKWALKSQCHPGGFTSRGFISIYLKMYHYREYYSLTSDLDHSLYLLQWSSISAISLQKPLSIGVILHSGEGHLLFNFQKYASKDISIQGLSAQRKAVSGEKQNFSGNQKILPRIWRLGNFLRDTK